MINEDFGGTFFCLVFTMDLYVLYVYAFQKICNELSNYYFFQVFLNEARKRYIISCQWKIMYWKVNNISNVAIQFFFLLYLFIVVKKVNKMFEEFFFTTTNTTWQRMLSHKIIKLDILVDYYICILVYLWIFDDKQHLLFY